MACCSGADSAKCANDKEGNSERQPIRKEHEASLDNKIAPSGHQCCQDGEDCVCNDDCLHEFASVLCSRDCGSDWTPASGLEKREQNDIAPDEDLELIVEEEDHEHGHEGHEHGHEHNHHDAEIDSCCNDGHSHSAESDETPNETSHTHHDHHRNHHDFRQHASSGSLHSHKTGGSSRKRSFDEKEQAALSSCCSDRPAKKQCCKPKATAETSSCCKPTLRMVDKGCCTEVGESAGCCTSTVKQSCNNNKQAESACCEKKAVVSCCGRGETADSCCDEDEQEEDDCCKSEKSSCCEKDVSELKIEEITRGHRRRDSITDSLRSAAQSAVELFHSIPVSIKHHHHKFRYRRVTKHDPCAKHISEATLLLQKGVEKPCYCRLAKEMSKGTSGSNYLSSNCCELRKKRQIIKEICCAKKHEFDKKRGLLKMEYVPVDEDKSIRLVFAVTGMTCSGCGAKMERTLANIPGVVPSTVRVSFLLSRAECRYDASVAGGGEQIGQIIKQRTGFVCSVLIEGAGDGELGARICINATEGGISKLQGVEGVGKIVLSLSFDEKIREVLKGKSPYLIDYDPQVIGARDIMALCGGELTGQQFGGISEQERARGAARKHLWMSALRTLFAVILTIPVAILAYGKFDNLSRVTKGAVSLPLAVLVQISAYTLYQNAVRTAFYQKEIDMDVLVVISTSVAFIFSLVTFGYIVKEQVHGIPSPLGAQDPLFETSTMLISLIFMGRLVTAWVRDRASRSGRSMEGLQSSAGILETKEGRINVDARLLHYNDVLIAEPGEKLVTDGVVVSGQAEVDESLITGEARPVLREGKARVLAGSTIVNGTIKYRVTRLVNENTISSVKRLVQLAATSRNRTQDLADQVASYLTPVVLAVSAIIFLIWTLVRIYVNGYGATRACIDAITFAIATLAISCPCAIGLAIPMVLVVGTSIGMKKGVVFKSAVTVENAKRIKHAVFDKTGTLTNGRLKVHKAHLLAEPKDHTRILNLIWNLTSKDRHPVSVAVTNHVVKKLGNVGKEDNWTVHQSVGNGLEATLDNGDFLCGGKLSWVDKNGQFGKIPAVAEFESEGLSMFAFSRNGKLAAVFGLSDMVRPEVANMLVGLREKGIETHLVSGDLEPPVRKVADQLNFKPSTVRFGCLPQDKVDYIRSLDASTVLFVGDGNNDALALGEAAVGVSMTNSADLASSSAQVEILSDNLNGILLFLRLAKRMRTMIVFNLAWSLIYNFGAILLAGGALEAVHIRIQPNWAGAGEMVSILPVIVGGFAVSWWF